MTLAYTAFAHILVALVWALDKAAVLVVDTLDRGGHWARLTDDEGFDR